MPSETKSRFTRWSTFALFGFLVLAFGLWGVGDIFRGGSRLTVVAEVGNHEITVEAYADSVRREAQALQRDAGQSLTHEQMLALGLGQKALTPLLQQALVGEFANDMGLVVSEQQLLAAIANEKAFQRNGVFDQAQYVSVLRQAGLTEPHYLWLLRSEILRSELFRPAGESVTMPATETVTLFNFLAEQRVAQFITITNDSMTELPAPTDEQLQQVYQDQSGDFQAPEYRAVTLLYLTPQDFFGEVTVGDDEVLARYESTPEQYQEPERRALRQIVFDTREQADAALAAAKAGKTLDEIATEDGTSVVSLALQAKVQLAAVLPELAEAAFALPQGEDLGVAQTVLGYHLFQVTQVEEARERGFDEVKADIATALQLERAKAAMAQVANQIDSEMATGATLDETAGKLQLTLRTIDAVDAKGLDAAGHEVTDLPAQVLQQIFQADSGIEMPLSQTADGAFYSFRVDDITAPAQRPFPEVKDQVTALWESLTRGKLAEEKASALAQQINEGQQSLEQIATAEGLTVQTSQPMGRYDSAPDITPSSALPPVLFGVQVGGAVTAAVDGGVLVAVLSEIRAADREADAERFSVLQQRLDHDLSTDVLDQTLRSLSDAYPVEINQQAIEQVLSSF